jgi:hypothetical protein
MLLGTPSAALAQNQINHDAVIPIGEIAGPIGKYWQPQLKLEGSCAPFPAVDAAGNWSGGLRPTGPWNSGCGVSRRGSNVYYRSMTYAGQCMLMYAWYFPKDSWVHRHDWEWVSIWLNRPDCATTGASVTKVTTSAHGGVRAWLPSNVTWDGSSARIATTWDFSFALTPTRAAGGKQTLVNFDYMPGPAKASIDRDWGRANFPLGGNFMSNVEKAYRQVF